MFDYAIIGAGINGCALAHFLTQAGKSVALFDRGGIASGGSGAAGAFVSPKISKSGLLKELHDAAFAFSMDFYQNHFPECIKTAPLLHLAKHRDENEKVAYFKAHTPLHVSEPDEALMAMLRPTCKDYEALYLDRSGVVDAKDVCKALSKEATFFQKEVRNLTCNDGKWSVEGLTCKHVVLATGAYESVLKLPYIKLRGVWGHRIDIATRTDIACNIHQQVSIAATCKGKTAIGATHNVHYHPQKNMEPYDIEAGRAELLEKANMTLALEAVEVLADYTGLRSGSNDYVPLLGSLVDDKATLQKLPNLVKGEPYPREAYAYHPHLSIINGTGGYGFVFGPWLAHCLAENLLHVTPIDARLDSTRFFDRHNKK